MFKARNYYFGYETGPRKANSYLRKSMNKFYTNYEAETYSRIQQNDCFDHVALEKIKKTTKEFQHSLEKCFKVQINYQLITKNSRTNWFSVLKKNKGIIVENFLNRKS